MEPVAITAIVLSRRNSGESDRTVSLFSLEEGKIQVVMKGARKPSSRLSAASEPLTLVRLNVAPGKARRFAQQTQIESSFSALRSDYPRLLIGLSLAAAVEGVLPEHMPDESVYRLLLQSIRFLSECENPWIPYLWATVHLMELSGNKPHFSTCFVCSKPLAMKEVWFSPHAGGATCDSHRSEAPEGRMSNGYALYGLEALSNLAEPPAKMKLVASSLKIMGWCLREFCDKDSRCLDYAIAETNPVD